MSSARPKLKPETPKVITAWDVRSGRVVYWTRTASWSTDLRDAAVLTGDAAEAALAKAAGQEKLILDPYFMEVADDGAVAGRETIRETIRAQGPTSRLDLGRQAGNA